MRKIDKIKYIRIKTENEETYSEDIPIGANAENIDMQNGNNLQDTIGNLDIDNNDNITEQLTSLHNTTNQLDTNKLNKSDVNNYVPPVVTNWLNANVNPVGSAVTIDKSLSIEGSAADAKITGDKIKELKSVLMNIVSLQNSDAFEPKKNWYDPALKLSGYYINANGKKISDTRFALYPIIVPAGKIVFTSGRFGTSATRSLGRTIRQNCVFDDNWNVISADTNEDTAYKYQNTTGNQVVVIYSIYDNHPTVTVNDLMIQIVDDPNEVRVSEYETCTYIPTNKANFPAITSIREALAYAISAQSRIPFQVKRNYYREDWSIPGYYMNYTGKEVSDSRYACYPIRLPAGKTVFSSGRIGTANSRTLAQTVRQNCVFNQKWDVVSYDMNESTAYKVVNNTQNDLFVVFTVYYNHSIVVHDLMLQIVDNETDVKVQSYQPFLFNPWNYMNIPDNFVDYNQTTFLKPKKNYYDPSKIMSGYYVKPDGTYVSDARFAVFPISVPAGKTVYSSGRWGS